MTKQTTFSYSDSMRELEKIIHTLECGQESLEQDLVLYEKGMQLCKQCKEQLDLAELKIENTANAKK